MAEGSQQVFEYLPVVGLIKGIALRCVVTEMRDLQDVQDSSVLADAAVVNLASMSDSQSLRPATLGLLRAGLAGSRRRRGCRPLEPRVSTGAAGRWRRHPDGAQVRDLRSRYGENHVNHQTQLHPLREEAGFDLRG